MNSNHLSLGVRGKTNRPEFSNVFRRTRLFELFERALEHPILWITSPGGAGKTVAVSSYLAEQQVHALWYSIDKRDEDPAHFFIGLGNAVAHLLDQENLSPLPCFTPECLGNLEIFARNFFEELFHRLQKPCVLTLDNFQEASDTSALHEALRCAGELVPAEVNMIVISRELPPSAFTRLQVHGDLSVIGWEQMRLTLEEAQGLADIRRKETVSIDLVRDCYERAQGWAAGVVLLLDYEAGGKGETGALNYSKPELLFNYFISEIFGRLPQDKQTVLMQCALLPKFTLLLAAELTQNQNVSLILNNLQQHSFFIARRSEQETDYEFHPLFHEFLILKAKQVLGTAEINRLQHQAAVILCGYGRQEEAIPLFIKSQDWRSLSENIQMLGQMLLMQGRQQTLAQWLSAVPEPVIHEDAWLLYYQGYALFSFNLERARENFGLAFSLFKHQDNVAGLYLAWCSVIDTYVIGWSDFSGLAPWVEVYSKLKTQHPVFPSAEIEVRVHIMLLALLHSCPQHPDLPAWAESAYQLLIAKDHGLQGINLACALMLYYLWTGDFNKYCLLLNITSTRMKLYPEIPAITQIVLTNHVTFHWTTGRAKEALQLTFKAFDYADKNGLHFFDYLLGTQGVIAALSVGDPIQAQQILDRSRAHIQHEQDVYSGAYHFAAGLIRANFGEWVLAKEHFRLSLYFSQLANQPHLITHAHSLLVHALYELNEDKEADQELQKAFASAKQINSQLVNYTLFMTEVRRELKRGNYAEAVQLLSEKLTIYRECGGFAAGCFWGPAFMAQIYTTALEAKIEVPFVQEMIRRLGLSPTDPATAPETWPWPIRIHTLGQFKIIIDDKALTWTGKAQRKPLELLKALIAMGGHDIAEEKLCEAVWPDADGDAAHRDFSSALYRLRRLLGNDKALRIENARLSLEPKLVWLDSRCFEARLQAINLSASLTDKQHDILRSAMALYQGVFLPDENAPVIMATRNSLHNKFCRTAETIGKILEAERNYSDAVTWYQIILEFDPYNESIYQRLMRGYQGMGQISKALKLYEQYQQLVSSQLKRQPSAELQALYCQLAN